MSKFNKWIRSKTGMYTIGGIIAALIVVAILGQVLGWWAAVGGPGAAGLPQVSFPQPQGGYTCLPTCVENDGKFLYIVNSGMRSFAGSKIVVWIGVPGNYTSFELGIFDGDSGKDNSGNLMYSVGNWDDTNTEATYTLYADPLKDGSGTTVLNTWRGNQDPMPNNAWYNVSINNSPDAKAPSQHYFYRLEVTQPVEAYGGNGFKLRSNGYLSAGREFLVNSDFAVIGDLETRNDIPILYPEFQNFSNLGSSTYTGDWQFSFYVPNDQITLEFWDGDFDRGTSKVMASDSDDPNTEGKPAWAGPFALDESAGGKGSPADDSSSSLYRRDPPVNYELVDPDGTPVYVNGEPSGTEEWERFVISIDPNVAPELLVSRIKPGFYMVHIVGLDLHNLIFMRTNFEICDPVNGCGPCVWPGCDDTACPRTIGYWKNNVKKIYIENRTKGIQESRETLDWGFKNVAMASPLYRHGINVQAPVAIADPTSLTPQEANAILQKTNGNSMLDRALQQNLATWMNLATGKVNPNTVVHLQLTNGSFDGTMWEALQETQSIILAHDGARMERAKDIADMINNRQLNADPNEILACTEYDQVIPPTKQPPKHTQMPKAPKNPEPENPTPVPPQDPQTCGARVNTYGVENPTNNPFYGIKFEYQSGEEVKDGAYDEFKVTLTSDQVAALTTVQMEAKAGQEVSQVILECDFANGVPCGPVTDDTHLFAFSFMSSQDNGDGTVTLTFQVQVLSQHGLSHATVGLPEGVVPSNPTGSYQSEVCP